MISVLQSRSVRERGRRSASRTSPCSLNGGVAVLIIALLVAVAGVWTWHDGKYKAIPPDQETVDGLSARTLDAGWVAMESHDSTDTPGQQMPAQMMPGAPEGNDMRLGVKLTLVNRTSQPLRFDLPSEFQLGGGRTGENVRQRTDTFGELAGLAPGNAVDGFVYFDTSVPGAEDPPFYLIWRRGGSERRLAVHIAGGTQHQHGASAVAVPS